MSRNRRGYDFRPMNELNEHGTLLGQVGYKPHSAVYVLAAAAVLFLLMRHLFGVIMALMCIAGALFIKLKVEDHPVMDVYDDAVIFYDPVGKAVGICHAGWPGTLDNICALTLKNMRKLYGTDPKDVIAGIGPSIGPCHFEVKEDVAGPFRKMFGQRYNEISELRDERIYLNLWKANRMLLEEQGVQKIETAELCTVCHRDEWFSHRGDKGKSGRYGVLITLNKMKG